MTYRLKEIRYGVSANNRSNNRQSRRVLVGKGTLCLCLYLCNRTGQDRTGQNILRFNNDDGAKCPVIESYVCYDYRIRAIPHIRYFPSLPHSTPYLGIKCLDFTAKRKRSVSVVGRCQRLTTAWEHCLPFTLYSKRCRQSRRCYKHVGQSRNALTVQCFHR